MLHWPCVHLSPSTLLLYDWNAYFNTFDCFKHLNFICQCSQMQDEHWSIFKLLKFNRPNSQRIWGVRFRLNIRVRIYQTKSTQTIANVTRPWFIVSLMIIQLWGKAYDLNDNDNIGSSIYSTHYSFNKNSLLKFKSNGTDLHLYDCERYKKNLHM